MFWLGKACSTTLRLRFGMVNRDPSAMEGWLRIKELQLQFSPEEAAKTRDEEGFGARIELSRGIKDQEIYWLLDGTLK